MNNAKLAAILTTALTLIYVLLLGNSALAMFSSGHWVGIAMGVMLTLFPILGIIFISLEVRFGIQIEKLATRLEAEGAWPKFDFELRPSGRVVRSSADAEFKKYQDALEADRGNWRNWFALGLVYDAAGDRSRAREAMREALKLSE